MTKEMLKRIKEFAEWNMNCKDSEQVVVDTDDGIALSNPWIDCSARFPLLTDEEAIKVWGLNVVMEFCEKAEKKIVESHWGNKKVGVTYEITRRYYEEYEVTEEEYSDICGGSLPDRIAIDMETKIDNFWGSRDDNWTATNVRTGEVIQDWRDE